eukprot:XP_016661092.1 PREDICTED: uncharacterized protein LOC107884113 [Acyrthosiphon pisum]
MLRCSNIKNMNEKITFNYHLNKTSVTTAEVTGNFTTTVPIDDSLTIEIDMAVKDSIGGWKDNAHLFKTPRACSSIKSFFGDNWPRIAALVGHPSSCPIPRGTYTTPGITIGADSNISQFPKRFFYGTYKMRFRYTKNKETYGCLIFVIEIKRPWETD